MNAESFKRQVRCYTDCKNKIQRCDEKLEEIWYRYSGVTGIRYDKIPTAPSETAVEQMKLSYSEMIENVKTERKRCVDQLEYIEYLLGQLEEDTRDAVMDIYVRGKRYTDVAKLHYISKSGLQCRIANAIEKVVDRM